MSWASSLFAEKFLSPSQFVNYTSPKVDDIFLKLFHYISIIYKIYVLMNIYWYYLYIIHFSDVTLLFEQWIIFKNLQFILLFSNIWTLTFYCFRLKNVIYKFWDFRVSNNCWAFSLSKLPSNHSATVTTLLYSIISIYDSW